MAGHTNAPVSTGAGRADSYMVKGESPHGDPRGAQRSADAAMAQAADRSAVRTTRLGSSGTSSEAAKSTGGSCWERQLVVDRGSPSWLRMALIVGAGEQAQRGQDWPMLRRH